MRNIYIVDATIIDANGSFGRPEGYPKTFDSNHYGNDVEKTFHRADGDMAEVWGMFCKRDDRQIQTVELKDIFGVQYGKKSMGNIPSVEE